MVAILLSMVILISCEEDNANFTTGTGTVTPVVKVDASIVSSHIKNLTDMGYSIPQPEDFSLRMADESGAHTGVWKKLNQFYTDMPYRTGNYTMTAYYDEGAEGFDKPSFIGITPFTVENNTNTLVELNCKLANTILNVDYAADITPTLSDCTLSFHCVAGGEFLEYPSAETHPLFINPGDIAVMASVSRPSGESVRVVLGRLTNALPAHQYTLETSLDNDGHDPKLTVNIPEADQHFSITLSDALFDGNAPAVTPAGFTPGQPLTLTEGETPANEIAMTVSGENIEHVMLSTRCPSLIAEGMPTEIDLLNLTAEGKQQLNEMGLQWDGKKVVFNQLLTHIDYSETDNKSSFTLVAYDNMGRINDPTTLSVNTLDAPISVTATSASIIGINNATITLATPSGDISNNISIKVPNSAGMWNDAEIVSITSPAESTHIITFKVPEGNEDIDADIYYCGRLKSSVTIKRVPPVYQLEADAFAHTARFRVKCDDASVIPVIIDYITLFNGGKECTIFNRDRDNGIVEIIGLDAYKKYTITPSLLPSHGDEQQYCRPVSFTTEKTAELPNGDFEDNESTLKYNNLQSGGRYSQTIIEIYDRCNHTSYNVETPRGWATVNAKTFCTKAKNKNTWYMQPSTAIVNGGVGGAFAVQLTNVAWDTDGAAIPDYTQESTPYLHYNPNVPHIAHKAAGRLWLGSYSFNAETGTESIVEGIGFGSRPSALNGYYKYMPGKVTTNERAYAEVKVWGQVDGKEVLIAGGKLNLSVTPAYTTFSIPLTYHKFGVKATKLCVMMASSADIGTIDYESAHITTTPDPVTASSTGNVLCIDNLSLAY